MQVNPDQFQAIAVGKKTYAKEPVFNIETANISCDKVVRLLGIDIDYHISCDKVVRLLGIDIDYHISCDKVVRLLGIDIDNQLNFDKHLS